jgi:DNA repair protein RecO (recombination protein O)
MSYLRDRVFILKTAPFREHDAWISMYGREHGKLEAVARGIRSWKAKHLGHLEPLTQADVMIAKGTSFDKLAVAQAAEAQCQMRSRLGALVTLGSFAHLVDQLTRPGLADPEIFDLLQELHATWSSTVREPSSERAKLLYSAAAVRLLTMLGYAPSFERADVSDEAHKLLQVLPRTSFSLAVSITAPASVLSEASQAIEAVLRETPLAENAHGPATIVAFLT